jgi:hypothetical protein
MFLAYAATSANADIPLSRVATALGHLGWAHQDGSRLEVYDFYRLPAYEMLINTSERLDTFRSRPRISPPAAKLARAALRRPTV